MFYIVYYILYDNHNLPYNKKNKLHFGYMTFGVMRQSFIGPEVRGNFFPCFWLKTQENLLTMLLTLR